MLHITVPENRPGTILVTDLVGNQMAGLTVDAGRTALQVDMGGWASATYVITFICNEGAFTRLVTMMR